MQAQVVITTIFTDTQPAAKSQNIADTVNYAELSSQAAQLTVEGEYLLIESLVEDLAALTLDHPTAKAAYCPGRETSGRQRRGIRWG